MSKRITSGSFKASSASDEAFGRLKNWAERIDEEIARLESEARRKMMTCSFDDKNGLPAPICDTIRDNVEEMSQMVQAMVRAVLAVRAVEYRKNTALQPFFFHFAETRDWRSKAGVATRNWRGHPRTRQNA